MSEIQYLVDSEYKAALVRDMDASRIAHLCTVRLSQSIEHLFGSWLRGGGLLYCVTNSVARFPADIITTLSVAGKLRELGVRLTQINAPYLLHPKILTFAPDIVYLGSHNMTPQSLARNIERSVRIKNLRLYNTVITDIWRWGRWEK